MANLSLYIFYTFNIIALYYSFVKETQKYPDNKTMMFFLCTFPKQFSILLHRMDLGGVLLYIKLQVIEWKHNDLLCCVFVAFIHERKFKLKTLTLTKVNFAIATGLLLLEILILARTTIIEQPQKSFKNAMDIV